MDDRERSIHKSLKRSSSYFGSYSMSALGSNHGERGRLGEVDKQVTETFFILLRDHMDLI